MTTSCDTKHQKRLLRMLSKYGDVKKDSKVEEVKQKEQLCTDSCSGQMELKTRAKRSIDNSNDSVDGAPTLCVDSANNLQFSKEPVDHEIESKVYYPLTVNPQILEEVTQKSNYEYSDNNSNKDASTSYFLDFFSNENEKESQNKPKPYVFINSFRKNEVPLIPANFYRRKNEGFLWRWTGFKFLKNLLDNKENRHRPIFTYWLMLLEIVIFFLILFIYGIGSFGVFQKKVSDIVWHHSNSYQLASYYEPRNVWLGPSPSVLIREGAIFSPCMKKDKLIFESIQRTTDEDSQSGCCIRMDNSGCVQTIQSKCSNKTSVWLKSKHKSGPVCGQDPNYCLDANKNWPESITDWPICHRLNRTSLLHAKDPYMRCKVQARPCCVGIYGKCTLASKEYCEFVKGKYHTKATLCSQVNCLNDVCGLVPFEKEPNQLYRLVISLFLHAGIFQLLISLFIQYRFMAVFEETYGTRKIIALYLISGIGGNLASALFLPTTPEIGPMGAFFGILSLLLYDIISNWSMFDSPLCTFLKVGCCLPIFFLLGFIFPWINNFSNIFGFVFGQLTVFLILPDNRKHKSFWISLVLLIFLTSLFLFFFYNNHYVEPFLRHLNVLNCIPFSSTWCSSMDISYKEINVLN